MVFYKPPITFVKSTGISGVRSQYLNTIAPTVTEFTRVLRKRAQANTLVRGSYEPKDLIRLLLSLVRSPVMHSGHIVDSVGACSRALQGHSVKYRVFVHVKGFFTHVDVNLSRLMAKHGSNIGFLRSQICTTVLRTRDYRSYTCIRGVKPQTKSVFHRYQSVNKLIEDLRGNNTYQVRKRPRANPLDQPAGFKTFDIMIQALVNPFMLLKFYFPEVFLPYSFHEVHDHYFRAIMGYYARKGTIFEEEEHQVILRPEHPHGNIADVMALFYLGNLPFPLKKHRDDHTGLLVDRRRTPPFGSHVWPHPHYAIANYFQYTTYILNRMQQDPNYIAIWNTVRKAAGTRTRFMALGRPSLDNIATTYGNRNISQVRLKRFIPPEEQKPLDPYLVRRFHQVFKWSDGQ